MAKNAGMSGMFIISCGGSYWGPFRTADEAAKWAASDLAGAASWVIIKLKRAS